MTLPMSLGSRTHAYCVFQAQLNFSLYASQCIHAFKAVQTHTLDIDYASQEEKSMIILPLYYSL